MRVTIASRIFSPEPAAASYRLAALADALDSAGATVTVVTTTVRRHLPAESSSNVRVRRFPVVRDKAGYVRGYVQYMSFDIPLFFRILFARKSDVIIVEPPPTTGFAVRLAAGIRRVPYVYYAADVWSDAAESTGVSSSVVRVVRRIESFALHGAKAVIAVTDGVAERVGTLAGHDRITVVRNGIDTSIFAKDGPEFDSPPMAIYAGTTSEWQGAEIFLRAMPEVLKTVPDARLAFLGQGTAREGLERLAEQLGLTCVEFHGVVPPTEVARWLRSARVGLVSLKPDQGYDFAIPTKIFAAAGCGTPVIFAGPGPSRALVETGQLGYALDYDTGEVSSALAEALSRPVDTSTRARISEWARRNVSLESTGRSSRDVVLTAALHARGERRSVQSAKRSPE